MGRGLTSAPRSFRSLDVSDGGHAVTVTEALLWSWSSVLHEPRACSRLSGVCSSSPRLPRSARVRCVRPARSAPTSSTCCPSPRPSGQPLGSGRCEPPPSLGAGLDSAPGGVRSLGGAPVAEWLLGLLFRTGACPGQRPGIPGPRHGSRSVSEHGPLTDRVARDRPSGPGCRCTPGPAEVTPVPGLGDRVRRLEAPVRHLGRRGRVGAALGPCALAVATLHRDPLRPRARGPSGL